MSRAEAYEILTARMEGAPSFNDYVDWLIRQPDWVLIALAQGEPVHATKQGMPL